MSDATNWRDHTNNMTVAERAEAAHLEVRPGTDYNSAAIISRNTTFGHVCANAELERRLAVEAERDELKRQLAEVNAWAEEKIAILGGLNRSLSEKRKALEAERNALAAQLEHDRTLVADCLTKANREIDSRHWLTEGRGPYEWNDDRYREEFHAAAVAIKEALAPMSKVAADWAGCPRDAEEIAAARRDIIAERDALRAKLRAVERQWTQERAQLLGEMDQLRANAKSFTQIMTEFEALAARLLTGPVDKGKISDGYHTFDELYEHRHALFAALLCRTGPEWKWKSRRHSDGSEMPGWFIVGIRDPQITYHVPDRLWDRFRARELDQAPPWDGHTSADVIERLWSIA